MHLCSPSVTSDIAKMKYTEKFFGKTYYMISVFTGLLLWFKLISHSPLYILILSKIVKILSVSYVPLLSLLPS